MAKWVRTKQEFEFPEHGCDEIPNHTDQDGGRDYRPTEADVEHSCLIVRLLHGKEPLSQPPPKSFSSPDYDLAEGKAVEILGFSDDDVLTKRRGKNAISINQHGGWEWHDREKLIIRHIERDELYQLREEKNKDKQGRPKGLQPKGFDRSPGRVYQTKLILQRISDDS